MNPDKPTEALDDLLASLRRQERTVFLKEKVFGLDTLQTARSLGISISQVRRSERIISKRLSGSGPVAGR